MSTRHRRATRSLAAAVVVCVGLVALVGCAPARSTAEKTAATKAGDGGFSLAVHGAEVTAVPGTAANGTNVTLKTIRAPIPDDVSAFATPAGTAIDLSLDGKQPSKPLKAVFDIPAGTDPRTVFVVGSDPKSGSGAAFVDSTVDASNSTVTATLTHLSWYAPVVVKKQSFASKLGDWIRQSLGTSSAAPSCASDDKSDLVFSAVRDNVVWPCGESTAAGADISLQSNSGLVWQVKSEPSPRYDPLTATTASGVVTGALANLVQPLLRGDTVVLPMETTSVHFEKGGPPYTIALKVEPGLSQIATIMWGLSMFFPSKLVDTISKSECVIGVVKSATASPSGDTLRSILTCAASALKGAAGALLGLILSGPALLSTQLEGVAREISGADEIEFHVAYRSKDRVGSLPSNSTWLYNVPQEIDPKPGTQEAATVLDDGAEVTFQNSTNIWVGCDGDSNYTQFYPGANTTKLSLAVGLEDSAPPGMKVWVRIGVFYNDQSLIGGIFGGEQRTKLAEWTVEHGTIGARVTVDVTNVREIAVFASTDNVCPTDQRNYVALLDAYVQ